MTTPTPITLTCYRLTPDLGLKVYRLDLSAAAASKIEDRVFASEALRTAAVKALLVAGAVSCNAVTRVETAVGIAYAVRDSVDGTQAMYLGGQLVGYAANDLAAHRTLVELGDALAETRQPGRAA